jgi:hypothetical protein
MRVMGHYGLPAIYSLQNYKYTIAKKLWKRSHRQLGIVCYDESAAKRSSFCTLFQICNVNKLMEHMIFLAVM